MVFRLIKNPSFSKKMSRSTAMEESLPWPVIQQKDGLINGEVSIQMNDFFFSGGLRTISHLFDKRDFYLVLCIQVVIYSFAWSTMDKKFEIGRLEINSIYTFRWCNTRNLIIYWEHKCVALIKEFAGSHDLALISCLSVVGDSVAVITIACLAEYKLSKTRTRAS